MSAQKKRGLRDVAYQIGASVRGNVNHAVRNGERASICGCLNVSLVNEPWDESSPWNCAKCARVAESFGEVVKGVTEIQPKAGRGRK